MTWQPIETAPKDREILLGDGGFCVQGVWDDVDYNEFTGSYLYDWTYGPAEIDPTNWRPTHWRELPEPPK